MKLVALLVLATLALAAAQEVAVKNGAFVEVAAKGNCFPNCKWNCDQPNCPAVCEPQCEKPACELRCEKLPATSCDIRCEKPQCEVRCSRNNCQSGGCPLCENVCMPAKCQTVCTPSVPVCKPTCSAPRCSWACRKPTTCPKPKCNLGCDAQAGDGCGESQCCSCNSSPSLISAMEIANKHHESVHGAPIHDDFVPSLIELSHEFRMQVNEGARECCPCQN